MTTEFPDLRRVCAWCTLVMSEGAEPTTHGICPACARTFRASYLPKATERSEA